MILFNNDISGSNIHKSFNNQVIEFYSNSLLTPVRATIDFGSSIYEISPSPDGIFQFNLKYAVNDILNANDFKDPVIPDIENLGYVYDDDTIYKIFPVDIEIEFDDESTETASKSYQFIKGVQQIGHYYRDRLNNKNNEVLPLLPFYDYSNISFHATYHVGYPFDIPILAYNAGIHTITNKTNGISFDVTLRAGLNRIFFSDGNSNFTIEDDLPLLVGVNEIEIAYGSESCTIYVTKRESGCGPFLKWYSPYGGYSYFLFDEIITSQITTKIIDQVQPQFESIEFAQSFDRITGKTSSIVKRVFIEYLNDYEHEYLKTVIDSPFVELFIDPQYTRYDGSNFRGVVIGDSTFTIEKTKKKMKRLDLQIRYTNETMKL